jgi:hypothetical protein
MDLPPVAVAASLGVTAFAVFASLYVMAARYMYELALHDLRTEANQLRTEYTRRLEALRRAGQSNFDVDLAPTIESGVDILPDDALPTSEAA